MRGYHPLLAIAAGSGDVLMARLRGGNANSGRSAGHFLTETIGRVRAAGATGQLTVRADSGFYAHAVVAAARRRHVRFSITVRQHASVPDSTLELTHLVGGGLVFRVRDESVGFGNRGSGLEVANKLANLLNETLGERITVDFEGVDFVSASFADEVLAKLIKR